MLSAAGGKRGRSHPPFAGRPMRKSRSTDERIVAMLRDAERISVVKAAQEVGLGRAEGILETVPVTIVNMLLEVSCYKSNLSRAMDFGGCICLRLFHI
jgi:hypothetical protein